MRIIRNYLLKELLGPFLLSLLISTFILTASQIIQMTDFVINKGISAGLMFKLIALLMPSLLTFTIPISALSAVLLGFARLTSDNEIIALRASGVSISRLATPVLLVGLLISLFCIPLNYIIMPETSFLARKLVQEIGVRNPIALIEPGVFIKVFKNYVIFVYDIKGNQLKNIRIYQTERDTPIRTLIAESGEIISEPGDSKVRIKLTNGIADESGSEDPDSLYKLVFKNYYLTLDLEEKLEQTNIQKKAREMTLDELKEEIVHSKGDRMALTRILIEIHNKIALAFSSLIFILLAIPIGIKTHRREKSINFGMALTVFMIYWTIMLGGVACVIRQLIPAWLGVWMPNITFGIVAIILFAKSIKK